MNTATQTYKTPAEAAAEIRAALKSDLKAGQRQVSVRAQSYSGGSSLYVLVHDPALDLGKVKQIARQHERIHRDDMTGEILCGANRFVDVTYSPRAVEAFAEHNASWLRLLAQTEPVGNTHGTEINRYSLALDGGSVYLWAHTEGERSRRCWLPRLELLRGAEGLKHLAQAVLGLRQQA